MNLWEFQVIGFLLGLVVSYLVLRRKRVEWHIDSKLGSDQAKGDARVRALKTFAEFKRRTVNALPARADVYVCLHGDMPPSDPLSYSGRLPKGTRLLFQGGDPPSRFEAAWRWLRDKIEEH